MNVCVALSLKIPSQKSAIKQSFRPIFPTFSFFKALLINVFNHQPEANLASNDRHKAVERHGNFAVTDESL